MKNEVILGDCMDGMRDTPDKNFFSELFRISKNQIIWGANNFFNLLPNTNCFIFWDKVVVMENYADGELAWTSFDRVAKQFRYVWSGNRYGTPENIQGVGKPTIRTHPTEKPVALYKWLLQNYAKPGDKILNTHIGSGSIRIACDQLGFELTGYELDPEYYEAQELRFQRHKNQLTLF